MGMAQRKLDEQREAAGKSCLPSYIYNLPGVRKMRDEIAQNVRSQMLELNEDMQDSHPPCPVHTPLAHSHGQTAGGCRLCRGGTTHAVSKRPTVHCGSFLCARASPLTRVACCPACIARVQAHVDSDMTPEDHIRLAEHLLGMKADENPYVQLQMHFEVRGTNQEAARHDDLRDELLASLFLRHAAGVGPRGVPVFCHVGNGGKTNINGNIVYSGSIPAKNPELCFPFARACLLLYRFKARAPQSQSRNHNHTITITQSHGRS
jgi:hypothetical protein